MRELFVEGITFHLAQQSKICGELKIGLVFRVKYTQPLFYSLFLRLFELTFLAKLHHFLICALLTPFG